MAKGKEEKRNYDRLRAIAEGMYIEQDMDGREIAATLEVSEVTVSRWKTDGDWESKKKFIKLTPARLRARLLEEAEKVIDGKESNVKADVVTKLLAGADRLASKVTPDVVHSVLKECCSHIATIDPKAAIQMARYHRIFLQYKIESEG